MNYCFIVNPASGRGKGLGVGRELEERLQYLNLDYQVLYTKAPGHAIELAQTAKEKFECVVAVGGDGTLNEVVNGLGQSGCTLGLLPVGSGNDFARAVLLETKLDVALNKLLRGRIRAVDLGKVNERYFHNGVGVGFDAHVVHTSLKVKRLRGNAIYLYSVLRTLFKYRPVSLAMEFNNQTHTSDYFMVTVGNGMSLGGGFYLTPDAQIDDGLFDLCLIQNMPMPSVLRNLLKVYSGKHKEDPRVEIVRTENLKIRSREPFAVHEDGELLGMDLTTLNVEIIPKALNVIC